MKTKKRKSSFTMLIFVVVFLIGLSLVLYPSVSNYWNSLHSTKAIATYAQDVADISEEKYKKIWQDALDYNQHKPQNTDEYALTDSERANYENLLNVSDNGVMAYIEIPVLSVALPIYHGTSDSVLSKAIGHLEWSSLPVGGESTHCVLSGHRGLPSARLFTDLDKLVEGDIFIIYVLNEILTYEVDQILIVEPTDLSSLSVEAGEDLCTLITCTPYGINTHRLLIRGHRIENLKGAVTVVADAIQINTIYVALSTAIPVLIIIFVLFLIFSGKKIKKRNR